MTADPDRSALRAVLRARRIALPAAERVAAAEGVARNLVGFAPLLTGRRVAGYWAVEGELPLACLLPGLRARGQQYLLPVIGPARRLRFAPWQAGMEIRPNRHGIPEPLCEEHALIEPGELDVVLMPLVGFDRRGHRLGFGGGYYDRAFAFLHARDAPARPVLVGIAYATQEVPPFEAAPWDVRLDYVATERELMNCG
ncbi:MAG TPA: 5-formyltetrahydrofolate cyclo-ligase [Rhodanobacteraceae bacterium]|nr:5-formyltetrahydrofolate cyclo-ligase [Rhodanobacteraceae bacterium]